MIKLKEEEVETLLHFFTNPEEKQQVKTFLREFEKINSDPRMQIRNEILTRKSAKKVLDIITRVGLEIGKHIAIEELIHTIR